MEAWKTLLNTALLGTQKRGGGAELSAALTGVALPAHTAPDPEAAVLRDAAILSAYRRGGLQPLKKEVRFEGANPETKAYSSSASQAALADLLYAGNTGMLRLWLNEACSRQQLIPPIHLAAVLTAAQKLFVVHPQVRATAGERGTWLAGLNPDWRYITPRDADEHWETGNSIERSAWLQQLRLSDPESARELLQGVWDREPADQRERLLATFDTGLSAADLVFLEHAATDKSKRVTAQATALLMRLPASSIVKSFEAWLRAAVEAPTSNGLPGTMSDNGIRITFPEISESWMQDILGKKSGSGTSEASDRLLQIGSHVPPVFWERHLDAQPEQALELLAKAAPAVFPESLIASAARFDDRVWAGLLANRLAIFYPVLLPLLDSAAREAYLKKFAATAPEAVLQHYAENDDEWLPELAPILLAHIASQPYQYTKTYFGAQAWRMPLSLLASLDGITPAMAGTPSYMSTYAVQVWPANRLQLREALELKARILQSFT